MENEKGYWEHFFHKADIGLRGVGINGEIAFEQIALALTAVITDLELVSPVEQVDIVCEESDPELLLVDWLNALIYQMSIRKMVFSRISVKSLFPVLSASVWGELVNATKHAPAVEVKGATYSSLSVRQDERGWWYVQCVVDV